MIGLTERQKMVLDFIVGFMEKNGYSPTYREIGRHMNINSTNGVSDHLYALERKGYISREYYDKRGITILKDSEDYLIRFKMIRISPEDVNNAVTNSLGED